MKEVKTPKRPLIFYYLDILCRQEYQNKTYDNTVSEETITRQTMSDAGDMDVVSQYVEDVEDDEDRSLTDNLFYFWGPGFTADEYLTMQEEYEDYMTRYIIDGKAREELVKDGCRVSTLKTRALKEGDIDLYNKLSDQWKKMMDAAELSPRAEKNAARQAEIPLGQMIQRFENEKPIPKADPEWEDVDGIMKLIVVYFIGHLCAMLGIKQPYAKYYQQEMDKYRAFIPEYEESDDDEIFDAILDYLVERHLADVDYNSEDGKSYITIYL